MKKDKKITNKNIIFSFDDGRKDTYDVAYKIMKKNGLVGTIHVITGCLDGSYVPSKGFVSGNRKFVALEDLYKMKENGFEISSHSDNHLNDCNMIKKSLCKLVDTGLMDKDFLTFSSPASKINEKNYKEYDIDKLNLKYLRTGIQMRNERCLKKIAYFFQKTFKSKYFFYYLNKDNIMSTNNNIFFIKTIAIRKYNTFGQVKYMIKKMKDNETAVLLFHSINKNKKISDNWGFYEGKFEKICEFIARNSELKNCTIKDFVINNG